MGLPYRRGEKYTVKGNFLIDMYQRAVLNCAYAEIARAECNAFFYDIVGELLEKKVELETIDSRKLLSALRKDLEKNKKNLEYFLQQLDDIENGKLSLLAVPKPAGYGLSEAIEMLERVLKK